jgi:hypothetical protein
MYLTMLDGELSREEYIEGWYSSKGIEDHLINVYLSRSYIMKYMKPDIYLPGGIMLQARYIYWSLYELDITTKITLSSLALTHSYRLSILLIKLEIRFKIKLR